LVLPCLWTVNESGNGSPSVSYEQQRWGVLRWMSLVVKWNSRSEKRLILHLFNYEYLYIGGEAKVTLELPPNVKIIPNISGLLGGIALWQD